MEEHRRLKKDSEVRLSLFHVLRNMDIANRDVMFKVVLDAVMFKHGMSGEQWDD